MKPTVEEQARQQGWRPQEEYNGDPEKWKPAEEFLAVGNKIAAVQSERNDKLLRELTTLKNDIASFKEVHTKEMRAAREDAYNRAVSELRVKQREAVENGDIDEFDKIEKEINETPKPVVEREAPKPNKDYIDWAAKNPWYGSDNELTEMADIVGEKLRGNYSDMTKFYNAVTDRVKKMYPDKFDIKEPVQDVEQSSGGGGGPKQKSKHSYKSLPDDAKAACDKYIAMGLYKNKEDYVKEYYGE